MLGCCERGDAEKLRSILVHKKADPNSSNRNGSALSIACKSGFKECVEILLNFGANWDSLDDDGLSAAEKTKDPEIYQYLVEFACSEQRDKRTTEKKMVPPLQISVSNEAYLSTKVFYDDQGSWIPDSGTSPSPNPNLNPNQNPIPKPKPDPNTYPDFNP